MSLRYIHFKAVIIILLFHSTMFAGQDTLTVMTYNVLNYGDGCQASNPVLHRYLKTIVAYAKPDILGLVKMNAINLTTGIHSGTSPFGFADSIANNALNTTLSGTYAYGTLTNVAGDNKTSVLFFNTNKLGFISTTNLAASISDFNLHKLYYKDPNLAITKDTTFLYVVLNHTQSGTDASSRNYQEAQVLQAIINRFYKLPNLLMMGDFNIHNSSEQFYQNYIAASDTNFKFYDTPFSIDNKLSYPIDWDNNPASCAAYLTTSTRQYASIPNTCGTDGGAKSWYDHILISPWIKNTANYVSYIANSYQTIGNDGHRLGLSINDSSVVKNTSAPPQVINALFQLSNKYPVSLKLAVQPNTTGQSPADPDKAATVTGIATTTTDALPFPIAVVNPVTDNRLHIYFSPEYTGYDIKAILTDQTGRIVLEKKIVAAGQLEVEFTQPSGIYHLTLLANQEPVYHQKIVKY